MTFSNTSGEKLNIDYKGSSDGVKNALSLEDNSVLGKNSTISTI
jgi:hypothetical protein